jgi:hypothetical protein
MVIPIVMIALNPVFLTFGLISKSQHLVLLLIILQSASPSAQVIVVALNQLGIPQAAGAMSYMFVFLYFGSIFSVTLWTTVAMAIYY